LSESISIPSLEIYYIILSIITYTQNIHTCWSQCR